MAITKQKILKYLEDNKLFEEVDDFLISELIYQQSLMREAKKDIKTRGILVDVSADGHGVLQKNQSVSVYESSLKVAMSVCKELGLSPAARKALRLELIDDEGDPGID